MWTVNWLSNAHTAEMCLNMTIGGLAVKNITDKMNSSILTVSVFFFKNQEHKFLRFIFFSRKWIIIIF